MATYDHFEPLPIRCPACGRTFSEWVGTDGPGRYFLYREGARQPVDQLVDADARTPVGDWPAFRLPPVFMIRATGDDHVASATGVTGPDGTWVQSYLHHESWAGCVL